MLKSYLIKQTIPGDPTPLKYNDRNNQEMALAAALSFQQEVGLCLLSFLLMDNPGYVNRKRLEELLSSFLGSSLQRLATPRVSNAKGQSRRPGALGRLQGSLGDPRGPCESPEAPAVLTH